VDAGTVDAVGGEEEVVFGAESLTRALGDRYHQFVAMPTRSAVLLYRARQRHSGRGVVIKLLVNDRRRPDEPPPAETLALATLAWHRHVVHLVESGTTDDQIPYLVVDDVGGRTYADATAESGCEATTVLAWCVEVAGALSATHEAGIVHCDVKPSNVLIARDGTSRLSDFGIARIVSEDEPTLDDVRGTMHYVAPEVLDGAPPTPASDVYGLARTALFGLQRVERPDEGSRSPTRHVDDAARSLNWPGAEYAARTLTRALDPDPDRRPQMAILADAMNSATETTSAGVTRSKRRPMVVTCAVIALTIAVLGLVSVSARNNDPGNQFDLSSISSEEFCQIASRTFQDLRNLVDGLPARIDAAPETFDLMKDLAVVFPDEAGRAMAPLLSAAERFPPTREFNAVLTVPAYRRLVLADGLYVLTRFSFVTNPGSDINRAEVPLGLQEVVTTWDRFLGLAGTTCGPVPQSTTRERVGAMIRSRMRPAEDPSKGFKEILADPRSISLFTEDFLLMLLNVAPGLVDDQFSTQGDWIYRFLCVPGVSDFAVGIAGVEET